MKRHRTPSQIMWGYLEFREAVLRALPRDINPDTALNWTKNVESLARVLRKTLMPDNRVVHSIYSLAVDYQKSVEHEVKEGQCYDWVDSNIASANFPSKWKGTATITVELIHFDCYISTEDALLRLNLINMRPAELHELLALVKQCPNIWWEFSVVALGSLWQNQGGDDLVPFLHREGLRRGLGLRWVGGGWSKDCRFVAVRK